MTTEAADPTAELDALRRKVEEARELIARLRQSNRKLERELHEERQKVETRAEAAFTGDGKAAGPALPETEAELRLLRRERQEIRSRVERLLERLEAIEL